ncbi:MAG: hypothetical protein QM296_09730 [Bacillota bacterium]|nr:hypothetical protein [Bacillota bacterium]
MQEEQRGISDTTLVVAIGCGRREHRAVVVDLSVQDAAAETFVFRNSSQGFESFLNWIRDLESLRKSTDVLVGMQFTGQDWLSLYNFLYEQDLRLFIVTAADTAGAAGDPAATLNLPPAGTFLEVQRPYEKHDAFLNFERRQKELLSLQRRTDKLIQNWLDSHFRYWYLACSSARQAGLRALLQRAPWPEAIVKLGVDGILRVWRDAQLEQAEDRELAERLLRAAKRSESGVDKLESSRTLILKLYDHYDAIEKQLAEYWQLLDGLAEAYQQLLWLSSLTDQGKPENSGGCTGLERCLDPDQENLTV